jgi:hypothetical protein
MANIIQEKLISVKVLIKKPVNDGWSSKYVKLCSPTTMC